MQELFVEAFRTGEVVICNDIPAQGGRFHAVYKKYLGRGGTGETSCEIVNELTILAPIDGDTSKVIKENLAKSNATIILTPIPPRQPRSLPFKRLAPLPLTGRLPPLPLVLKHRKPLTKTLLEDIPNLAMRLIVEYALNNAEDLGNPDEKKKSLQGLALACKAFSEFAKDRINKIDRETFTALFHMLLDDLIDNFREYVTCIFKVKTKLGESLTLDVHIYREMNYDKYKEIHPDYDSLTDDLEEGASDAKETHVELTWYKGDNEFDSKAERRYKKFGSFDGVVGVYGNSTFLTDAATHIYKELKPIQFELISTDIVEEIYRPIALATLIAHGEEGELRTNVKQYNDYFDQHKKSMNVMALLKTCMDIASPNLRLRFDDIDFRLPFASKTTQDLVFCENRLKKNQDISVEDQNIYKIESLFYLPKIIDKTPLKFGEGKESYTLDKSKYREWSNCLYKSDKTDCAQIVKYLIKNHAQITNIVQEINLQNIVNEALKAYLVPLISYMSDYKVFIPALQNIVNEALKAYLVPLISDMSDYKVFIPALQKINKTALELEGRMKEHVDILKKALDEHANQKGGKQANKNQKLTFVYKNKKYTRKISQGKRGGTYVTLNSKLVSTKKLTKC